VRLFCDGEPFRHGPLHVWYWNLEDPRDEIERRVLAVMSFYNLRDKDIGDRLIINSGRDQTLAIAEPGPKGSIHFVEPLIDAFIKEGRRIKTDVIIVDPFVSSHHLSENDNMAIDAVAKRRAKIGDILNAAVEVAHHIRKPSAGTMTNATDDDARGQFPKGSDPSDASG